MTSKAAKTKQFIIETAARLFNKNGYDSTSMSDLQDATGLSKGCLYGNFKNKDAIAKAAFDFNTALIFSGKEAIGERNDISTIEKLYALLKLHVKNVNSSALAGGCPLLNSSIEVDDHYPFLRNSVRSALKSWELELVTIMKEGQQNNEIKLDIDPTYWSSVFIAMIEGGLMLTKIHNDSHYIDKTLNAIRQRIIQELVLIN